MADIASLQIPSNVNPDLQVERDNATFNPEELTFILDGGKQKTLERRNLEKLLHSDPAFGKHAFEKHFLSRSEIYAKSVLRATKLFTLARKKNWTVEDAGRAIQLANGDIALGIHHGMFMPALERLGTEEQKAKWLEPAKKYKILGTYAQTEMGHGTYLRGLETIATYDPNTEEFIMDTPTLSAMKWWPGSLGKSVNCAVVLATLIISGKKHGMQAFFVPLRSMEDHKPLPGIRVGDIGPKIGMNSMDNGYLIFNKVRIPRENMLMKNAQVTRDGKFISSVSGQANYGTMTLIRVQIVRWAMDTVRNVSTVAIRYSAVRRQSKLDPNEDEAKILDFQTQQHKLFPALATAYALHFSAKNIMERYTSMFAEISQGNFRHLPELHSQSSGMKALASDIAIVEAEICRQACGGHGFLKSAAMSDVINTSRATITVEGENTVLYLQVARYLIKQVSAAMAGTKLQGSTAYLSEDPNTYTCPIMSELDCRNLSAIRDVFKHRAQIMVVRAAESLQSEVGRGVQQHVAMNNNLVALVRAAKAHVYYCLVSDYIDGVLSLKASPQVVKVMRTLCTFFGLYSTVLHSGDFLETEAIGLPQLGWIKNLEIQLLGEIRPNAVALVDAFDVPDESLGSVLGCYDGNVYPRLFKSTELEPLNKTEVHSSYYEYLKPFIEENNKSKL